MNQSEKAQAYEDMISCVEIGAKKLINGSTPQQLIMEATVITGNQVLAAMIVSGAIVYSAMLKQEANPKPQPEDLNRILN